MFAIGVASLAPLAAPAVEAVGSGGPVPQLSPAQSTYALRCAGCHGIQGQSVPQLIPVLRGNAGYFLCTRQGRDYLVRLPNVALAAVSDEELAEVLNFVVFSLAAGTTPREAAPYTAAEVKRLRAHPLNRGALFQYREQVVDDVIQQCGAPASLRDYRPHSMH